MRSYSNFFSFKNVTVYSDEPKQRLALVFDLMERNMYEHIKDNKVQDLMLASTELQSALKLKAIQGFSLIWNFET